MAQRIAEYPLLASFFCCTEELTKIVESEDIALNCIIPNQWYTFEIRNDDVLIIDEKLSTAIKSGEAIQNPIVYFGSLDAKELRTVFFPMDPYS